MKKKFLIIISCVLICLFIGGCKNNESNEKDNNNSPFTSKVITKKDSYDYNEYQTITSMMIELEQDILGLPLYIESIYFQKSDYIDETYNTVNFIIENNYTIIIKFDENEEFCLANIPYIYSQNDNSIYLSMKSALLRWNYFNFNGDEWNKGRNLKNDTIKINNFELKDNDSGFYIIKQ